MENKTNQEIYNKLTAIESLLEGTHQVKPRTLVEAAKFLDLSPSHLYKLTSERKIPHFKPNGKKIYFDESELVQWFKRNPARTQEETEEKAASYIVSGEESVWNLILIITRDKHYLLNGGEESHNPYCNTWDSYNGLQLEISCWFIEKVFYGKWNAKQHWK